MPKVWAALSTVTVKSPAINVLIINVAFALSVTEKVNADVKEVHLLPILRGDTESGKQKEYVCEYEGHIIEVN